MAQHKFIGERLKRREDSRLLMGAATYVDDLRLPSMRFAAILRSPHAHARITAIDTSAARALTGVNAVLVGADVKDIGPVPCAMPLERVPYHPVLARDRVRFVGEPVAVVVADTPDLAHDALDLIRPEYEPLELPVWIQPGQADGSVAVQLGYGRTQAGRVGNGVGANTYLLRTLDSMGFGLAVTLTRLNRSEKLATVQDHGSMEGRPILREAQLEQYKKDGKFYPEEIEHPPLIPLWDEHKYDQGYQWGMVIDLTACDVRALRARRVRGEAAPAGKEELEHEHAGQRRGSVRC